MTLLFHHFKTVSLFFAICITQLHGTMFELALVTTTQNSTCAEVQCRQLGYDGLAVLSSPEVFRHAFRMLELNKLQSKGFYAGLHFIPETREYRWDDGTVAAHDTPKRHPREDITGILNSDHNALILKNGTAYFGNGSLSLLSLCGNYTQPSQAHVTNSYGQQPKDVRLSLSITIISSYLECTLLCALDYRCEVPHFASDNKTCSILAKDTYFGFKDNPQSQLFLRNRDFFN